MTIHVHTYTRTALQNAGHVAIFDLCPKIKKVITVKTTDAGGSEKPLILLPWPKQCLTNIYILIVALESDTVEIYHEFIAAYCYECVARVTMLEAMNE